MLAYLVCWLVIDLATIFGDVNVISHIPGRATAYTSLRGAKASANIGDQSSLGVMANERLPGGGTSLGSSGAGSGHSATGTSYGVSWLGGSGVSLGSAAADNRNTSSVSSLADSSMPGKKPYSFTSTSGGGGQINTRAKRASHVVSQEGSSSALAGDSEAVLAYGSTVGQTGPHRPSSSALSAGSTGVRVGRVSTAVSLANSLQTAGNSHSLVNAGSTAGDANGKTSVLSVGSTQVKGVRRR